ncbi:unnamed protein product [Tilletia caries]|uniref:Uncharacterized protein n=1 Tax=Tilletia caries TaxID=13290 RepID=A0ABN7J4F7_9BASI|nr:unnamed protein product [Tilletia caries]
MAPAPPPTDNVPVPVQTAQAHVDHTVQEARRLLTPTQLQLYTQARAQGHPHQDALSLARPQSDATSVSVSQDDQSALISALSSGEPLGLVANPAPSVSLAAAPSSVSPAHGSQASTTAAASTAPSAPGCSVPAAATKASFSLFLFRFWALCHPATKKVSKATTAVASARTRPVTEKRARDDAADDVETPVRPTTRIRTAGDCPGSETPSIDPVTDAFVRSFEGLSPSKQQRFVQAILGSARSAPLLASAASTTHLTAAVSTALETDDSARNLVAAPGSSVASHPVPATANPSTVSDFQSGSCATAHLRAAPTPLVSTTSAADPFGFPSDDLLDLEHGFAGATAVHTTAPVHPIPATHTATSDVIAAHLAPVAAVTHGATGPVLSVPSPAVARELSAAATGSTAPASLLLSHQAHDPSLLLGYDPQGTVGTVVQLPCQLTLNKVGNSSYVDLWSFTPEGMAAGFTKVPMLSGTGRHLLDQLGTELELPKGISDEPLPLESYFRASQNMWR